MSATMPDVRDQLREASPEVAYAALMQAVGGILQDVAAEIDKDGGYPPARDRWEDDNDDRVREATRLGKVLEARFLRFVETEAGTRAARIEKQLREEVGGDA